MIEIKILVIEQQNYIANLEADLRGKNMSFVYSNHLNIDLLQRIQPDLVVLDVSLISLKKAINACQRLHKRNIPFVIITNHYTYDMYMNFNQTLPRVFLNRNDDTNLKIGIIIVLEKMVTQTKTTKNKAEKKELFFFIKESNNQKERISINDILWIRSDGNYCYLKTEDRKYVMRKSLKQVHEKLPANVFIQVFRGIIVQKNKIDRIDIQQNHIFIKEHSLPLGRKYKQAVMNEFNLL